MAIFHSYVKLPEDSTCFLHKRQKGVLSNGGQNMFIEHMQIWYNNL